jgi:hypothetical protein
VGSTAANADTRLRATLTVSQEVPVPAVAGVGAHGTFTATLNGRMLRWHLSLAKLSGAPVAATIRTGGRGLTGPKFIHLCAPCSKSQSGTIVLTAAQAAKLRSHATYVTVGTHRNPNGEVRGQIQRR